MSASHAGHSLGCHYQTADCSCSPVTREHASDTTDSNPWVRIRALEKALTDLRAEALRAEEREDIAEKRAQGLESELAASEAHNVRLQAMIEGDTKLLRLEFDATKGLDAAIRAPGLHALAAEARGMLDESDAPNYLTLRFRDDIGELQLVIQRPEGESPTMKAARLTGELDASEAGHARFRAAICSTLGISPDLSLEEIQGSISELQHHHALATGHTRSLVAELAKEKQRREEAEAKLLECVNDGMSVVFEAANNAEKLAAAEARVKELEALGEAVVKTRVLVDATKSAWTWCPAHLSVAIDDLAAALAKGDG